MPATKAKAPAALGVLLIGALTSCSPSASPTAAHRASLTNPANAAASASPDSTPDVHAQAALTAYRQAWGDAAAVEDSGNYRDPRLAQHMGGQLLLAVSQDFYIEEAHGIASSGAPILHPRVSTKNLNGNPPTVTIADCIDFRHFIQYVAATGRQYGSVQTGLSADTTTMTLANGSWVATDDDVKPDNSCTL